MSNVLLRLEQAEREIKALREALGALVVLHEACKDLERDSTLAALAAEYRADTA